MHIMNVNLNDDDRSEFIKSLTDSLLSAFFLGGGGDNRLHGCNPRGGNSPLAAA